MCAGTDFFFSGKFWNPTLGEAVALIVSYRHGWVHIGVSLKPDASHTDAEGHILHLSESQRNVTTGQSLQPSFPPFFEVTEQEKPE